MAKLSADGKYVTVERGDTLWAIAEKHLGSGTKYKQLAAIPENKIKNPDLIYVGQKVYLSSPGTASKTSTSTTSDKPTNVTLGLLASSDDTLVALWDWGQGGNTENFEVEWWYDPGNGTWFLSGSTTTGGGTSEYEHATSSIPANARKVRVRVKPKSKSKDSSNGKTSKYFDEKWSSYSNVWTDSTPLTTPGAPSIEMKNLRLTAKLTGIDISGAKKIEFQVIRNNDESKPFATAKADIKASDASYSWSVKVGGKYKVRARAIGSSSNDVSEWSPYSGEEGTIPSGIPTAPTLKATSKTSIKISWNLAANAESYEVQYTTKKSYFEGSDQLQSFTVQPEREGSAPPNTYEKTGLETGQTYFFRVRAANEEGESEWSAISSITIGTKPTAPTTWSSTTTAIVGEVITLYWVHNAADGSDWRYSQLSLLIDGVEQLVPDIKNENVDSEDEENPTIKYTIDTSTLKAGAKIQWRVRTAGITLEYSDYSVERTIDVYAPPTLLLEVTDVNENQFDMLTGFPFYIYALGGPNTQVPIGYHINITSDEVYETTDNMGNFKMVNAGESVYSKYFDVQSSLLVEMSPANINLDNNISYTIACTVTMNSGLTTVALKRFTVSWEDKTYAPKAEIAIDKETLTAHVRPYCEEGYLTRYKVTKLGTKYTKTDEAIELGVYGELINGAKTATGEAVYNGTTEDGTTLYYCEVETRTLVEGITLSLYRREFDGSFTELGTGLINTDKTFVTDPHPALDYARYRVVAVDDATGAISYYDSPGEPTGITDIVIQWDEEWSNYDTPNTDKMQQPPWSGSMLRLPYDIDWSESSSPDVALVNYAGREHPVSYYGTQVGQSATGNTNVPYDDEDTIYALRRLQRWMGDVYVREPSGSGYWANVKVQISQKHCDVYVPVTLTITRVEGGI